MKPKSLLTKCGFIAALALNGWTPISQAAALKEVVLTDYVGNSDVEGEWPEYVARTVLRADGTAFYFGNPTYAPRKGQFRGTVAPADFAKIAALMRGVAVGKSHGTMRGSTRCVVQTTAENGARRQMTFWAYSEPKPLRAVQNIVSGLAWKIKWQPYAGVSRYNGDLSGVRGHVLRGKLGQTQRALGQLGSHVVANLPLSLRTLNGKEKARGTSDGAGRFCLVAPPGIYQLVPLKAKLTPMRVTVKANGFTELYVEAPR
jgi:hypothetical protein